MKKVLSFCIIAAMMLGMIPSIVKAEIRDNDVLPASGIADAFAEFEKTVDLDEWFSWFNSLTPEEQKSVNYRPSNFGEIERTVYGKDTAYGLVIDKEWFDWFNSLTIEAQRKIDSRPEMFATIQREVYGVKTLDGGTYTEYKKDVPLKVYRVDTDYDLKTKKATIIAESVDLPDPYVSPEFLTSENVPEPINPDVEEYSEMSALSIAADINVPNSPTRGGPAVYGLPAGWPTLASNSNFCSIGYSSCTINTVKLQINFLDTNSAYNQVLLWQPITGTWQNLAGNSLGLQQAYTGTYTIGSMIPSLTYQVLARTYNGGWRECVLNIKSADTLMPTGGGEMSYAPSVWNNPTYAMYSNCYTYALSFFTNKVGGARPGDFSVNPVFPSWQTNNAYKDQQIARMNGDAKVMFNAFDISPYWCTFANYFTPSKNGYRVAMYVHPGRDFHFYRQDYGGYWSHRRAQLDIENLDNSNQSITDPEYANRDYGLFNYTDFCGIYYYAFDKVSWH